MKLGFTATDRITGFTGIATGFVTYISGCNQVLLVPKVKPDGTLAEGQWFDVQRLEVQEHVAQVVLQNGEAPGADAAPSRRY